MEVEVGQFWEDCDPRSRGRVLQIIEVGGENGSHLDPRFVRAVVRKQSRMAETQRTVGKQVRIAKERLKPSRNGYRLVEGEINDA